MPDGHLKQCKPCFKIREKKRFAEKPEQAQARRDRVKAWRKANPERVKINQAVYVARHQEKILRKSREAYRANLAKERERSKLSYRKRREKHAAYQKEWKARNPEAVAAQDKRYAERHPEKIKAHRAVETATRTGRLTKPSSCQVCHAEPKSLDLHAHHPDYSHPLDIEWLCRGCHADWHNSPP